MAGKRDKTERKPDVHTCIVCIHAAANTVSVNVDERTPLISSSSTRSSGTTITSSGIVRSTSRSSQYGSIHRRHTPRHHQFSWLLVIALFLFFFTGIGIATYLLFNEGIDFIPEIYKFVARDDWNASMSHGALFAISVPADSVVLTDTRTNHCDNLADCGRLIRSIQNESIFSEDLPDLRYNFLIDDYGTIYEGIGWHNTLTQFEGRPLVALIGNYTTNTPTNDQIVSLKILLAFAVDRTVLTPCYNVKIEENNNNQPSLANLAAMLQVEVYNECI